MSDSLTSRTAVYGPVRTVVWQGSVGDRRPYADQVGDPGNTPLIASDYSSEIASDPQPHTTP
jgi:hypothetical protein